MLCGPSYVKPVTQRYLHILHVLLFASEHRSTLHCGASVMQRTPSPTGNPHKHPIWLVCLFEEHEWIEVGLG